MAQLVKNLPTLWETCIRSLGWEVPLEKGKVTHSSILAWRILWTEETGGLQSVGSQRVGQDIATKQRPQTARSRPDDGRKEDLQRQGRP